MTSCIIGAWKTIMEKLFMNNMQNNTKNMH